MRARARRVALLALVPLLVGTAAVALAQHRHRHRHRHGNHAAADAGTQVADAVDAGAAAPTASARGGRPTQSPTASGAPCVPGTHLVSMRSPPSSAARPCTEDGDCGLAHISCCAPCGEAGESDVVAIQVTAVTAWNESLCDGDTTCPRCRSQLSHTLAAVCVRGLCEVRVHEDCGGAAPAATAAPTHAPTTGGSRWTHTSDWNDSAPETAE